MRLRTDKSVFHYLSPLTLYVIGCLVAASFHPVHGLVCHKPDLLVFFPDKPGANKDKIYQTKAYCQALSSDCILDVTGLSRLIRRAGRNRGRP
ncbi:MAG: hypothetical protein JRI67_10750 [Deltaproteobacteria bacterium]|nr:hypothetical protein [Deltaproteobacteria bacterium]